MTDTIRLPDPLSQPGAPGFTNVRIVDNYPNYSERLPGGKVVSLQSAAQYWGITLYYDDLFFDEYNQLMMAIQEAKQTGKRLLVLLPSQTNFNVQGDTSGTYIAPGQKGANLVMTGFTATPPKVGDIFKLTNHNSKVYQIRTVSKVSGTLTLGIYPNLMAETTGLEKPIFNTVLYEMVLENAGQIDTTLLPEGVHASFQLELAESIIDAT